MNNQEGAPAPNPNAQRQREFRAKKKAAQLHEVRGIFATDEQDEQIKKAARKITNQRD